MNGGHRYDFEWDPAKAKQNLRKHGVSFERAAAVFLDPDALSVFDPNMPQAKTDGSRWAWISRSDARGLSHISRTGEPNRLHPRHQRAQGHQGRTKTVRTAEIMQKQYNFSKAERGKPSPRDLRSKFYKPNIRLNIPVYLEPKLQKSVAEIARRKGQEISAVVSHIVRKEVELIEEMQ